MKFDLVSFGAGALGHLVTSRVALAFPSSHVVLFTRRHDLANHVNQNGIFLEDAVSKTRPPIRVTAATSASDILPHPKTSHVPFPFLFVFILTKGFEQTKHAASLARLLQKQRPEIAVITMQNGIGYKEIIEDQVGTENVYVASTSTGAHLRGPGNVVHAGSGQTVVVSAAITPACPQAAASIAHILSLSGIPSRALLVGGQAACDSLLFRKLIVNAAINPVGALLGLPNGSLLAHAAAVALLQAVVREAVAVAPLDLYTDTLLSVETSHETEGCDEAEFPCWAEVRTRLDLAPLTGWTRTECLALESVIAVCRATASNTNSMLADVRRGAVTEAEAIGGMLVARGRTRGLDLPVNRTLLHLMRVLDARAVEARTTSGS